MTPERWQRIKEFFADASAQDERSERVPRRHLRRRLRSCAAEVASLLAAHEARGRRRRPARGRVRHGSTRCAAGGDRMDRPAPRRLRNRRAHRPRRHGRGVSRAPRRCASTTRKWRSSWCRPAISAEYRAAAPARRAADPRQSRTSGHRAADRRRRDATQGVPYLVHGARRRRAASTAMQARNLPVAGELRVVSRRLRGRELRASAPGGPPRSEARQHPRDGRRLA